MKGKYEQGARPWPGIQPRNRDATLKPEIFTQEHIDSVIVPAAKRSFEKYLFGKTSKSLILKPFKLDSEILCTILGIREDNFAPDQLRQLLDTVVLAVEGFVKVNGAYAVPDQTSLNKLLEKYGHKALEKNIFKIFQDDPQNEYSAKQIAEITNFNENTIFQTIKALIKEGRIRFVRKVGQAHCYQFNQAKN